MTTGAYRFLHVISNEPRSWNSFGHPELLRYDRRLRGNHMLNRGNTVFAKPAASQRRVASIAALGLLLVVSVAAHAQGKPSSGTWKFAVSGDSRNCGDVVMPAIAKGAERTVRRFTGISATTASSPISTKTIARSIPKPRSESILPTPGPTSSSTRSMPLAACLSFWRLETTK